MKNNTLLRTNLLVCTIIIVGFTITSIISYRSNFGIFQRDVELVSALSSEGLYNDITTIFSPPVNVSLTMANDSLLKGFLQEEQTHVNDVDWLKQMQKYLNAYRDKYGYDSIFLVSAATNRYYHFAGLNRTLVPGNPENDWYYKFLSGKDEHSLNVDNDEATDNSITVFINCKIKSDDGTLLGIVGVGLKVNSLQALLSSYEEKYGVHVYLVNDDGAIEISSADTGHENINLFDISGYNDHKDVMLTNETTQEKFWYTSHSCDGYVVSRYEPNLKWHLIVEKDTADAHKHFNSQLARNVIIIILIVFLVIFIITSVIKRYNARISDLIISQELEYRRLLHETTAALYENIFELDITNNRASGEITRQYFESLGISADTPYDRALQVIADKQIKREFIQEYLATFSTGAVMEAYKNGITNLNYDFMITDDGTNYHWIRISARIFYWNSDKSIRMITYRSNIDAGKKRELMLLETIQRDSMTGLYNKRATEELTSSTLQAGTETTATSHAFLIFDIDNFKTVNDTMGHSFGDHVINELAAELKTQFRDNDIVGRIGGDEFAVLMKNSDNMDALKQKLARLCNKIGKKDFGAPQDLFISCSIGVAVFPQDGETYSALYDKADQALYYAKSHGKNSYFIFEEGAEHYSFHVNQRDMEKLMNASTDGLAQYAYTQPLKLLYFNPKCVELFGIPAAVLSSPDFNPMAQVHSEDLARISEALHAAAHERRPFDGGFRIRHQSGHHVKVSVRGFFISELYKNKYPIFYVLYTKTKE